jgi:hypothetical protein
MHSLTALGLIGSVLIAPLYAQQPSPTTSDSTTAMAPLPPPPNPMQDRYLQGLRTAGRGVAQVKDGISRVVRTQSSHDTLQVRLAAKRLGGLCGAARGFISSGRGQMEPNAYDSATRKPAKNLVVQLDSLALSVKTCQLSAAKTPTSVTTELLGRLHSYETALATFRTAIGLPNR